MKAGALSKKELAEAGRRKVSTNVLPCASGTYLPDHLDVDCWGSVAKRLLVVPAMQLEEFRRKKQQEKAGATGNPTTAIKAVTYQQEAITHTLCVDIHTHTQPTSPTSPTTAVWFSVQQVGGL